MGSPGEEGGRAGGRKWNLVIRSGAGSWGIGSTWRGIVDGRAGCLDVALGVIDGERVGRGGQLNARLMG